MTASWKLSVWKFNMWIGVLDVCNLALCMAYCRDKAISSVDCQTYDCEENLQLPYCLLK